MALSLQRRASFVPYGCDEVSPEKGIRLLMGELAKEILPVNIEDELKQSYLDYGVCCSR
jgi:hypothetical protein